MPIQANRLRMGWLARTSGMAIAAALALPTFAFAQDQETTEVEELVITATRRSDTVQNVPLNIAAIGGEAIEEQGLSDLSEIAQFVPGVYIGDLGSRGSPRIIVRGLNASPSAAAEQVVNDGGGTVATYLGEIPLYIDLKLNDMERVEFLLGPQGTLYGAGTLGGAVRYIPVRPRLGETGGALRSEIYDYKGGGNLSSSIGGTFNLPIGDTIALRGSVDWLDDTGFVDYNYTVLTPGVSDPDPDFTNPAAVAANLVSVPNANTEDVVSGRVAARWRPSDRADITATFYYQDTKSGARQISQHRLTTFPVPVAPYESLMRITEPQEATNDLIALEGTFDLGFAELTSASGYSTYEEHGRRDQTDFLIALEYSYESFPSFTAFTQEDQWTETFTQELRLVSKGEGPISWIGGAFYNRVNDHGISREFTPGYDVFLGTSRPDALEYIADSRTKLVEMAAYGEVTWDASDRFSLTAGGRYFNYELDVQSATDLPLNNTANGAGPDDITLDFTGKTQKDHGFLYKLNASYDFTDDIMGYATISQGYRIGGYNGLEVCAVPLPAGQNVCAQPEEEFYQPDKTTNYEIGLKTQLFDRRLTLNGDIYYIEWDDVQLDGTTVVGVAPINRNGKGARSTGFETNFSAAVTSSFSVRGSFSYNKAELTADATDLITTITPPGFGTTRIDGMKGDRLPGSPEVQASLFASYDIDDVYKDADLSLNWGAYYIGDRLTRAGGRGDGITLDAYTIQSLSATLSGDKWKASLFVDNLFDEFAETGARTTPLYNQVVADAGGDPVYGRNFFTYVLPPRVIGIRLSRTFGDG